MRYENVQWSGIMKWIDSEPFFISVSKKFLFVSISISISVSVSISISISVSISISFSFSFVSYDSIITIEDLDSHCDPVCVHGVCNYEKLRCRCSFWYTGEACDKTYFEAGGWFSYIVVLLLLLPASLLFMRLKRWLTLRLRHYRMVNYSNDPFLSGIRTSQNNPRNRPWTSSSSSMYNQPSEYEHEKSLLESESEWF